MWLKIIRQNISHLARRAKGSASIEQKNGNGNNKGNKTNNNGAEVNRNEELNGSPDKSKDKKKPVVPPGGPLLQQTEISTSQLDFFRMLDEKIESGPDYDESTDGSHRAEHVTSLLRRWERASVSYVTDVNLNNPNKPHKLQPQQPGQQLYQQQAHLPNRGLIGLGQTQPQQQYHQQYQQQYQQRKSLPSVISAKDREGMRNIVGGRPEPSAPVYVQRVSTNRLDGLLQDGPSPNMPRHVLESISQSPTQSMKNPPGLVSSSPGSRYSYHHSDLQGTKVPGKPVYAGSGLNGEYSSPLQQQQQQQSIYRDKEIGYRHQQYDSLVRNSSSNPYVQQFQISPSPSSTVQQQQQHLAGQRKRPGYEPTQTT